MIDLRSALCIAVAILVAGTSAASAEAADWFSDDLTAAQKSALADFTRAHIDFYGITGLAVAVVRQQDVVYQATAGYADVEDRAPVSDDTLFQLSSSTKIFTGTLMTILAQEGLVDLEAPIGEYLTGLPEAWSRLTLVDLMGHISGLPEVLECGESDDRDAALACAVEMEAQAPPRERFIYTQTNYMLAQMIIEKMTGRSFADALSHYVLVPAGMASVMNGDSAAKVNGRALNYYPDDQGGIETREYEFPWFLSSAAGLNASLDDMIAFARALNSDVLLTERWKQDMWRVPLLNDGEPSGYTVGWDRDIAANGRPSFGHEGGMLTTFRVYPHAGLSVVVLTNGLHSFVDLDGFADALALAVEPGILEPVHALAYRAMVRMTGDDIEPANEFLREALRSGAVGEADGEGLILWLAEELADSGRVDDAIRLLDSGIEAIRGSGALQTAIDELTADIADGSD